MDERKRELLQEQLRGLSYKNGEGIVAQIKRKMDASVRVLLIGFGGTGLDAMECTMHELKQSLTPEQYKEQISVLAVDTSMNALYTSDDEGTKPSTNTNTKTEPKARFDQNSEWLLLPYEKAKQWKREPHLIPGNMKDWVNPAVFSKAEFSGKGASRVRQAGRILLTQPEAAEALISKVNTKASKLKNRVDAKLAIFLFCGIAGGTGSGCVIDGSYLIRHAVNSVDPNASFVGYIFLPAVGEEVNMSHNANAYAALKELAHFMTLEKRSEVFEHTYGRTTVVSKKNIFDKCILLEGQVNGINSEFSENRTKAFHAAANTVLDNITAVPVTTAVGQTFHSVDDYLDNLNEDMIDMITGESYKSAPRAAEYTFSVLGHASALVPIDLLKAYVMNQVFQSAMKSFANCEDAKREDAVRFLRECKVKGLGLLNERFAQTKPRVKAYLKAAFADRNRGPYYVVNLLNEAANVLEGSTGDQEEMRRYLRKQNNNVFNVSVAVIKEIAGYLEEASGILTNTELRQNASGSRFSWMLVEFDSKTAQNKNFAQLYLRSLIDQKRINGLVQKLLDEMSSNIEAWSELENGDTTGARSPRFAARDRLRAFIKDHVDGIVRGSVEDFLVRYYTNDIKAVCTRPDGSITESGRAAMDKAADEILKEMFTSSAKAVPLAKLKDYGMIPRTRFPSKTFMYVPVDAPNLKAAIENRLNNYPELQGRIKVYSGTASDRIACYWRYDCLPAHQIEWVLEGEKDYEYRLKNAPEGLHLSQTVGGKQWQDLPNLCCQSLWQYLEPNYEQPREAALAERAHDALEDARKLGLTEERKGGANVNICWLRLLPEQDIPAPILFKAVDHENEGTVPYHHALEALEADVDAKAQALYQRLAPGNNLVVTPVSPECTDDLARQNLILRMEKDTAHFNVEEIKVGGDLDVMTPGDDYSGNWTMDLAAELIRTRMDLLFRLRGNVLVMQKLAELVEANNKLVRHANASASAIDDFVKLCAVGILKYKEYDGINEDGEDDTLYQWLYSDEDQNQAVLAELNPSDDLEMTAKHYYAFQKYVQLSDNQKKHLLESLAAAAKTNKAKLAAKEGLNKLQAVLEKLRTATDAPKAAAGEVSENEQYFYYSAKLGMASAQFARRIKNEDLAKKIREFYRDIQNDPGAF